MQGIQEGDEHKWTRHNALHGEDDQQSVGDCEDHKAGGKAPLPSKVTALVSNAIEQVTVAVPRFVG